MALMSVPLAVNGRGAIDGVVLDNSHSRWSVMALVLRFLSTIISFMNADHFVLSGAQEFDDSEDLTIAGIRQS